MTKPTIRIHDLATNKIIDREMNDDEFTQYEADLKIQEEKVVKAKADAATKAALLDRLGITEDEARLLLS